MTRLVSEELSHLGAKDKLEEALGGWYMSRKEIEENSPSRKDGIGLKKEAFLRESYCTFLKDLGKRLKVRQITIATAIIFCHRFFLRQSHSKNDQWTIATVCMFLACKVEETPHPLKNVIRVSYEMIHEKDPAAAQRIKQKAVYEQQKELILLGERVVLATLGFDLNVQHPYEPLFKAIKKFNVAKYALLQVAWNFVNDGLSTSLCLQFKPNHIAASAIFLAAKFLKVKLPLDGEKVWWQEFDVTPRQLEEVSNQLLEFYKQNRIPPSQGSEAEGAAVGGTRAATKAPATNEKQASKHISSHPAPQHSSVENNAVPLRGTKNQSNDGSTEWGSDITDPKMDLEIRDSQNSEKLPQKDNKRELTNRSKSWTVQIVVGDQHRMFGRNLECWEGPLGHSYSSKEAIKMIDKDKLKVALGKRRKERGEMTIKKEVMDEDDLIERELEDGVELAFKNEKNRRERRQNWSKLNDEDHGIQKGQLQKEMEEHNAEEGEMIDNAASLLNNRKRGIESPPARQPAMKKWLGSSYHNQRSGVLQWDLVSCTSIM